MSHAADVGTDTAFGMLRQYARDHNVPLTVLARAVVDRRLPTDVLVAHVATRQPESP